MTACLMISAAHKSSGKTMVTVGLAAAFSARGQAVQTFKKGPDYIDPLWLAQASGRPCFNLDPHLSPLDEMTGAFARRSGGADLALVEGNKGLYDGLALDGSNSNAAVAIALRAPVVLVLDARGMTRGIAPLILGYQAFDRNVRIAGVILNRLGGARHEAKLRAVIAHYTDVRVLGAIQESDALALDERHLGLIPATEHAGASAAVERIGAAIADQVDLDAVLAAARTAPPAADRDAARRPQAPNAPHLRVRIGIARDRAFGFYYADDLDALRAAGAELVAFDTLRDARLPPIDALFIGGGFPETAAAALEANATLRAELAAAIDAGLPTYAECGGLMYLARSLTVAGHRYTMVGAIAGDVRMHPRPVGRGYVELEATGHAPWPATTDGSNAVRGHEFHYSSLDNLPPDVQFAWRVRRGHGIDGRHDGLLHRNLVASYTHLRSAGACCWARQFVAFAQSAGGVAAPMPPARAVRAVA